MADPLGPESEEELAPNESLFRQRQTRHGGSILMAAMLGLAQALGFENARERTVQLAEASRHDELDLDFGELPPLD